MAGLTAKVAVADDRPKDELRVTFHETSRERLARPPKSPLGLGDGNEKTPLLEADLAQNKIPKEYRCLLTVVLFMPLLGLLFFAVHPLAVTPKTEIALKPHFTKTTLEVDPFFTGQARAEELVDNSVDPCDDFYQHACGKFLRKELPTDHVEWYYSFDGLKERVAHQMRKYLTEDSGKSGRLFRSCQDIKAIDSLGMQPLRSFLEMADNVRDNETMLDVLVELHRLNSKAFFDWNVDADVVDPTLHMLYLQQGGLTLADQEYYLKDSRRAQLEALRQIVAKVMKMTGVPPSDAWVAAGSVVAVETDLAKMHLTSKEERNTISLPPLTLTELTTGMDGFPWAEFFDRLGVAGIKKKAFRVLDVLFFRKLCAWIPKHPPRYFRWYLRWRFLDALIGHLSSDFQKVDLEFRQRLYGVKKDPPRWRVCLHTLNVYLPMATGRVYVDRAIRRSSEKLAKSMLKRITTTFDESLHATPWMNNASASLAIEKLENMIFQVGEPDSWPALPVDVDEKAWFNNSLEISRFIVGSQLSTIGHPVVRTNWGRSQGPMSVNAFYEVHKNALFVPAALLEPPFVRHDPGSSYGALGSLLAHEMTHGFDNTGRLFGPNLGMKDWWDESVVAAYKERAACISESYAAYTDAGRHVHGNMTLGEDIADLGGLHLAHSALLSELDLERNAARNKTAVNASVDSVPSKQPQHRAFFVAWAQNWCHLTTKKMIAASMLTNPHAPAHVRVNAALSQFDAFSTVFSCRNGSAMNPAKGRCPRLW